MVHVAVEDLTEKLPAVERPRIEDTVRRWVHHWRAWARVQTFVGVFAERDASASRPRPSRALPFPTVHVRRRTNGRSVARWARASFAERS